jgi:prepilin-type N-terminal cleavage/methylation domain-containing protein
MYSLSSRKAFTLIELLVVIAIIAILAVVVVLTLNPAELLRQSRDANRLSDLATLNSAINLYNTDQGGATGYSLGSASTTYLSLPDPAATSTSGTNCSTMGLPATSSNWSYHCPASSTQRSITNLGWIPINFASISAGSPFSNLPIDPTNTSSSLSYYTYQTTGSTYEVTVPLESSKYIKQNLLVSNPDPTRYAMGSAPSLIPQEEGLVGYWPMDEGNGSTTQDLSGNGNIGTWSGTASGTSGYYSKGQVGSWGGSFDGSTTYVGFPNMSSFQNGTISFWVKTLGRATASVNNQEGKFSFANYSPSIYGTGAIGINWSGASNQYPGNYGLPDNVWSYVTVSWTGAGTGAGNIYLYYNAQLKQTFVETTMPIGSGYTGAGSIYGNGNGSLNGLMDDIRIYNRALSAAEIQQIYNAEK